MAFCANCGSEVQGKFCAKCGAPSGAAGTAGPPPPAASYAPAPAASAGLEENVAAALCYLLGVLTGVLFLVIEPYSRNRVIRFHAFQSIFVWLAAVVIGMVLSFISYVFVAIPFIGWLIYIVLWTAFSLGILVLWLFLMYKAYNRERFVVPVVGQWAEKQAQS
jgi:uncharacterized membrane protein